jgi:hypothetical protein
VFAAAELMRNEMPGVYIRGRAEAGCGVLSSDVGLVHFVCGRNASQRPALPRETKGVGVDSSGGDNARGRTPRIRRERTEIVGRVPSDDGLEVSVSESSFDIGVLTTRGIGVAQSVEELRRKADDTGDRNGLIIKRDEVRRGMRGRGAPAAFALRGKR